MGIEPTTPTLATLYSTSELRPHIKQDLFCVFSRHLLIAGKILKFGGADNEIRTRTLRLEVSYAAIKHHIRMSVYIISE